MSKLKFATSPLSDTYIYVKRVNDNRLIGSLSRVVGGDWVYSVFSLSFPHTSTELLEIAEELISLNKS